MKIIRHNGKPVQRHFLTYRASTVAILEPGWEEELDAIFDQWCRHGRGRAMEEGFND